MSHYNTYGPDWYNAHWSKMSDGRHSYHTWALKQLQKLDGDILDVGCGDGAHVHYFDVQGIRRARLLGCDFSPVAVEKYRKTGANAVVARAEALPFEDGAWPIVMCLEMLEHVENPVAVWDEIKRVAGHTVVMTVPPQMAIDQHKTAISEGEWTELLNLPEPSWRGGQQVGWRVELETNNEG